jgi:hypothetical protein
VLHEKQHIPIIHEGTAQEGDAALTKSKHQFPLQGFQIVRPSAKFVPVECWKQLVRRPATTSIPKGAVGFSLMHLDKSDEFLKRGGGLFRNQSHVHQLNLNFSDNSLNITYLGI